MMKLEVEAFAPSPSLRRVAAAAAFPVPVIVPVRVGAVFLFVPPFPAFQDPVAPEPLLVAPGVDAAFWVMGHSFLRLGRVCISSPLYLHLSTVRVGVGFSVADNLNTAGVVVAIEFVAIVAWRG